MSEMDRYDEDSVEQLREAVRAGRLNRVDLQRLLADAEDGHRSTPAPITDQMDVEELRRGHARIRFARRWGTAAVFTGAVGLTVAAALVSRFLWPSAAGNGAPAVLPASPARVAAPQPEIRPIPQASGLAMNVPPRESRRERVPEPEIEIVPTVRPRRAPVHRPVFAEHPRIATAIRPERSRFTLARDEPKRTVLKAVSRRTVGKSSTAHRVELASSVPESPATIPDEEFVPSRRTQHAPETAAFTPMAKEQVVVESRERRRTVEPERQDEGANRTDIGDDAFGYRARPGVGRSEPRRRGQQAGPMVERRICLDTRMLAGDRCPHTAIVVMPESQAPTRRCRVH
jgi:hypothetical protein